MHFSESPRTSYAHKFWLSCPGMMSFRHQVKESRKAAIKDRFKRVQLGIVHVEGSGFTVKSTALSIIAVGASSSWGGGGGRDMEECSSRKP